MKKLLALLLLSPFVYSELSEYYCEENVANYLTLKIDYDLNNPSFVIENHTDINSVGKNNFVADTDNIKIMPLTVFVATNDRHAYQFNRATAVLTRTWFNALKADRTALKNYNEFVKSDSISTQTGEFIGYSQQMNNYFCEPYKSK